MLVLSFVLLLNYFSAVTAQGVNSFIKCDTFIASDTASATQNFQLCQIDNVCPGVKLVIGDCSSSCSGDQYIRLFDGDNANQLAGNDDGACESPLDLCSRMEYSYTGPSCTSLVLRQGCFENNSCGGRIKVSYIYTSTPTYAPSALPTAAPSYRPTARPTSSPTGATILGAADSTCAPYTGSNTNNARAGYAVCNFQVCPGTVLTIGNCEDSCSGDQFIRLFDGNNNLVMYDDDGCSDDPYGLCSQLTYVYRSGVCQTFSLHQGCYEGESCSGTMTVVKRTTAAPTSVPTAVPTAKPSSEPTATPTAAPSSIPTAKPTAEPSSLPTAKPSSVPTPAPTLMPYTGFATTNINEFTSVVQSVWYRAKYVGVVLTFDDCTFNLADDATCQAAYPNSQIVTIMINGLPVKLAIRGEARAPSALPTVKPTSLPSAIPSVIPSPNPTPYPQNFPTVIPTLYPIAIPTNYPTPAPFRYFSSFQADASVSSVLSCVEICATFWGGAPSNYHCSQSISVMSMNSWLVTYGVNGCAGNAGDTYKVGSSWNCGYVGCATSAAFYNSGCSATNYCWRNY